jgi:hypothetical protein
MTVIWLRVHKLDRHHFPLERNVMQTAAAMRRLNENSLTQLEAAFLMKILSNQIYERSFFKAMQAISYNLNGKLYCMKLIS